MSRTAYKRISILDNSVLITDDVDSLDFAGTGVLISNSGRNVTATINNGGTGVSGLSFEVPSGLVNGTNTTYTVTVAPQYIVIDGVSYFEGQGFSIVGLTITTDIAPVGFIESAYAPSTPVGFTRITNKTSNGTISGAINGSNVTFTLGSSPTNNSLDLFYNGQLQTLGDDYTIVGAIITMIVAPETGTNLVANYYA